MNIRISPARALTFKDPSLLKDKCYIAGEWVGGAERFAVTNPVDDSVVGYVPKLGAPRRARRSRRRKRRRNYGRRRPPRSAPGSCANGSI